MFTIGQRPGGSMREWVEPTRGPAVRPDCNDSEIHANHHPGIHHEPYEKFDDFRTAIDGCLDGSDTVHKGEMETLMTHRFQLFEDVPLLAA
jgi:hypothetical protein